jgi:hypothetical protein
MIEELRPYLARRRERVKPKLGAFLEWLGRQKISAGQGLRVHQTDAGTVISASPPPGFIGAFRVSIGERFIRVGAGFVNGVTPTIEGTPITDAPAPRLLALREDKYWVFVQVKLDPETKRINEDDPEAVTIVADAQKTTGEELVGRHPIALVLESRLFQLSYFSLRHAYRNGRHFFVPA